MATPRFPDDPGRHIPIGTRRFIVARDGATCVYCWEEGYDIDHVYPWSQGGTHDIANLVCCCQRCNSVAGERVFSEFSEKRTYVRTRLVQLGERQAA